VPTLPKCCLHTHIGNSIVYNCNLFHHILSVCSMLKSLDALKQRLHCDNLLTQLCCQQRVVANVRTDVKYLFMTMTVNYLVPN